MASHSQRGGGVMWRSLAMYRSQHQHRQYQRAAMKSVA